MDKIKANEEDVEFVLGQAVHDDGRSGFYWFRDEKGDLILGVFPNGDTYELISQKIKF